MSVVVVGLEHSRTPLEVLERVVVPDTDVPKMLGQLRQQENIEESVLLSTCLRTEIYAVVDRFHDAVDHLQQMLATRASLTPADLTDQFTVRFDDDVPVHLFAVSAGLESVVLGETEILGQVRRAWERAEEEHAGGPVLAELFRHALRAGRRVRSETAIARGTTSFSHAAVELAERARPDGLPGTTVMVVGAGDLGTGVVRALVSLPEDRRPAGLVVANRTSVRGREALAPVPPSVPCRLVELTAIPDALAGADVVLVAIDTDEIVLDARCVLTGPDRTGHPLTVVDMGMPRNVEVVVGGLPGVHLLDLDDLRGSVARATEGRQGEVSEAAAIVGEEVDRYRVGARARGAAPVISALRHRLEAIRVNELGRQRNRFTELSEQDWQQVDEVTRAVLAKLLHEPTELLKESSGSLRGERLVETLRTLFDL